MSSKTAIKEFASIKHGFAFEGKYFSSEKQEHILLTPGNFHVDQKLYFGSNTKYYRGPIPEDYVLSKGDLLVVMTDLTKNMAILGNAVILKSELPVLHNQRIGLVQSKPDISKDYLCYLLNSEHVKKYVKATASGTTVRHTSPSKILDVKVHIPPLPEQRKIAKILSTWDKAISTTERLIDNSKQQKKALMQQLLTGKKRLLDDSDKPFEGEYQKVLLEEHIAFLSGHAFKSSEFIKNGKYKLLRGINITKGTLRWGEEQTFSWPEDSQYEKYSLKVNDIVISMDGSLVGRNYALISQTNIEPMLLVQRVARLRCKNTLFYGYLLQHIASENFKSYVDAVKTVTAIPHISAKDIKHFKIPLPPVKEQEKIAEVLTNADQEIELLEQQLADLKQEKKALMQQLLTGKRRVKVDDKEVA